MARWNLWGEIGKGMDWTVDLIVIETNIFLPRMNA